MGRILRIALVASMALGASPAAAATPMAITYSLPSGGRYSIGFDHVVGTRTVANSEELAALLAKHAFPFRLLNAKQDAAEAEIIAQAGEPGAVTIATNMAGRGAHIPLAPASERAGGLHVIGLEGKTLKVHYQGACGSCPSSLSGTLAGIENLLKSIEPDIEVVAA